ncbi:MAG TPA: hypothetical protein VHE34_13010 [Puia sp.]|jgi:hypothetical protein|uniref:hypothetical protein n=1 Tax=Puia sp. TaxID=2045100 RepID=UPI002CF017E2|nr:hypothetical protein [Puia sp.]HVU96143.1 hypothetical protein [Puia sp.]
MRLLTPLLLLLFGFLPATQAQTAANGAAAQVRQLLKPGQYLVHYVRPDPTKQLTSDQKALLAKVQKALADKMGWLFDSTGKVSGNTADITDSIRKRMGLTKEEWKSFQDMADPAQRGYQIFGEDKLEIVANGDKLSFKGTGNAAHLNSVRFDLAGNRVLFGDKPMPFLRMHHSNGSDNAFHTPVVTYEYELENSSMADSTNMNTLRMERYDFGVARLPLAGKTILMFMTMNVQGGSISVQPGIALVAILEQ